MTSGTRPTPRSRVHPLAEILETLLRHLDVARWHRARVLLDGMEQDHEIARAAVEDAIARPAKTNSQLAQLTGDLRCDRKLGRRRVWIPVGLARLRHRRSSAFA